MKIKSKKCVTMFLTVFMSMFLMFSYVGMTFAGQKTLKVGGIMPLSGPISVIGLQFIRGYELYFDKVNDEGGIQIGNDIYKIDFFQEDSKFDAVGAATAAKKLIHRNGCKYIFGSILSSSAEAIYQVAAAAKALHCIAWIDVPGIPGDIDAKKPYAVRLMMSSDSSWEIDYDYLKAKYPNAKRVYIVGPDVGQDMDRLQKVAAARGITIVGQQFYPLDTIDFMPVYTKALAAKPDVIHSMTSGQEGYELRSARQLGFKGPFFWDSPTPADDVIELAGKGVFL